MVICIDCDNVLNNLQEVAINVLNEKYDTSYSLNDFNKYNVSECMNKEDAIKITNIYHESGIYDLVKPVSGAHNAIQKLIRAGHDVYIVTYSFSDIFDEKCSWIKYHFPEIDDAHIVAMKHKWLFKCDVMIEDCFETLVEKPYYHRICFDQPWNRYEKDYIYGVHRAANWKDVVSAVNEINKEESDII